MKIIMLDMETVGLDLNLDYYRQLGELIVYRTSTPEQILARLASEQPEVIITNRCQITKEVLAASVKLKLVCVTATGFNNIDAVSAAEMGIKVAHVPGYSTDAVAQHTFALLLGLVNQVEAFNRFVKSGKYCHQYPDYARYSQGYFELKGKTITICGLGAIGRKAAEIASAFGMKVQYYSASHQVQQVPYRQVEFEEMLATSDVISVHAALNERTYRLFDEEAFRKMKPNALFINVGRGAIMEDAALAKALQEGWIAGAGIDVLETEPIRSDNPLLQIQDNHKLLLTPHIAWAPYETRERVMREVYDNINAFQQGEERNVVN